MGTKLYKILSKNTQEITLKKYRRVEENRRRDYKRTSPGEKFRTGVSEEGVQGDLADVKICGKHRKIKWAHLNLINLLGQVAFIQ